MLMILQFLTLVSEARYFESVVETLKLRFTGLRSINFILNQNRKKFC